MFDVNQAITDKVIAMLDSGTAPWRSPILGRRSAGHPRNLVNGKQYRGVNTFLLAFTAFQHGYDSSYWLTFKQALERGGSVRKGEKSSMVVFWKELTVADRTTGKDKKIPLLRYYNVFNAQQCDGIDAPDAAPYAPINFQPIAEAEKIVAGYAAGPTIAHDGGGRAYYAPSTDSVHMPVATRMASCEEYYSTLFHELGHSTGHASRLDRKLAQTIGADYGREELIAEMSAAFLCARAGIEPSVIDNQAAYLAGWLAAIKADKSLIVKSAAAAQRSFDRIIGDVGNAIDAPAPIQQPAKAPTEPAEPAAINWELLEV